MNALANKVMPAAKGKKKINSPIPQAKRPKANVQEMFFTSALFSFCDAAVEINQSIIAMTNNATVTQ